MLKQNDPVPLGQERKREGRVVGDVMNILHDAPLRKGFRRYEPIHELGIVRSANWLLERNRNVRLRLGRQRKKLEQYEYECPATPPQRKSPFSACYRIPFGTANMSKVHQVLAASARQDHCPGAFCPAPFTSPDGGRSEGAEAHSLFGLLPMRKRNSPPATISAWLNHEWVNSLPF